MPRGDLRTDASRWVEDATVSYGAGHGVQRGPEAVQPLRVVGGAPQTAPDIRPGSQGPHPHERLSPKPEPLGPHVLAATALHPHPRLSLSQEEARGGGRHDSGPAAEGQPRLPLPQSSPMASCPHRHGSRHGRRSRTRAGCRPPVSSCASCPHCGSRLWHLSSSSPSADRSKTPGRTGAQSCRREGPAEGPGWGWQWGLAYEPPAGRELDPITHLPRP